MKTGAARRLDTDDQPQWSDPEALMAEIRDALSYGGAYARKLAAEGMKLFPEREDFKRIHHLLRPGEARVVPETYPDQSASYDWIRKNAHGFQGQWVALCLGEFIASGDFEEVVRAIQEKRLDPKSCVLHFVA
jgi:hypothetical protein